MLLEQPLPAAPAPTPIGDLARLVRRVAMPVVAETHRLWAPPGDRRWRLLAVTAQYDVWLIAWGAGSGLELHDHGGSSGALCVIRGALVGAGRDADTAGPLVTRVVRAPQAIVVPPTRLHEVTNPYRDPALSVHVYSPPLSKPAR